MNNVIKETESTQQRLYYVKLGNKWVCSDACSQYWSCPGWNLLCVVKVGSGFPGYKQQLARKEKIKVMKANHVKKVEVE